MIYPSKEAKPEEPEKRSRERARLKPINRHQAVLEVVDPERLIEADHPARAIWELCERLDLEALYEPIQAVQGVAGQRAHDPRVLLSLWVYGYSRGVSSARELARWSQWEPGMRWLTGLRPINYHTLSDFRSGRQETLSRLLTEVLAVLTSAGVVTLERVALDGTRVRANAGQDSLKGEATIEQSLGAAREHVKALESEDYQRGVGRSEAARRRAWKQKRQRLEQARQQVQALQRERGAKKARVSTTDPDCRVMKKADGGYQPGYNLQVATDAAGGAITAVQVSNEAHDGGHLLAVVEQVEQRLGQLPQALLADGGYTSGGNIEAMQQRGVELYSGSAGKRPAGGQLQSRGVASEYWPERFEYDPVGDCYRCPEGQALPLVRQEVQPGRVVSRYRAKRSVCQQCPMKPACCPGTSGHGRSIVRSEVSEAVRQFQERMESPQGQAIYRQRGAVAEFPFAWIKDKMRFRQFRLRGLPKVYTEALWLALSFNIILWIRRCWSRPLLEV